MFLKLQTHKQTNTHTYKQTNRQTDAINFYGLHTVLVSALLLLLVTAGLCSWYPYQIVFATEILILVIVRPEQPYLEGTMVINNNKSISSILRVQHAKHDMQLANSITNIN